MKKVTFYVTTVVLVAILKISLCLSMSTFDALKYRNETESTGI